MMYENTRSFADLEDQRDPLRSYRNKFYYPKNKKGENVIYFCGNSLGLQPKSVRSFIEKELVLWEKDGVLGQHRRWEHFHERLTHLTAHLVGAKESEVVVMNALTVNLHLLLVSFYQPNNKRNKIAIEKGAFPSDQYAIKSQIQYHGFDPKDCLIEIEPKYDSKILQTKDIIDEILQVGDELATILFGGVNYYTGQALDIKSITETGKTVGAFVGFDLAHAAGNLALDLHNSEVDFAAWCSYKYLCAGPGAPSGIFIHERHHEWSGPRLEGWWGHNKSTRFEMGSNFDGIQTAEGWQISNAPVMGMAPLLASMELYEEAGMQSIWEKGNKLTGFLAFLIQENLPEVTIVTPDDRGCQLSLVVPGGKSVFNSITGKDVICDWRAPDVIRVAPHPLYNTYSEVYQFVELLNHSING